MRIKIIASHFYFLHIGMEKNKQKSFRSVQCMAHNFKADYPSRDIIT